MSKFLVETHYTCTFKIVHELDELNEKALSEVDNRKDGKVEIVNVTSTENTAGTAKAGYNRTYTVTGISSSKQFSVGLTTDPGTFTNDTSARNTSLPYFKRKKYDNL